MSNEEKRLELLAALAAARAELARLSVTDTVITIRGEEFQVRHNLRTETFIIKSEFVGFEVKYYEAFRSHWIREGVERAADLQVYKKRSEYRASVISSPLCREKLIAHLLSQFK